MPRAWSAEHRAQSTGHRARGTEHRAQGTGHRAQGTGHRAQSTGHRAQGTGRRGEEETKGRRDRKTARAQRLHDRKTARAQRLQDCKTARPHDHTTAGPRKTTRIFIDKRYPAYCYSTNILPETILFFKFLRLCSLCKSGR